MTGQFRKSEFFTNAIGIPCHDETLHLRALISAARVVRLIVVGDNCIEGNWPGHHVQTRVNYADGSPVEIRLAMSHLRKSLSGSKSAQICIYMNNRLVD
jgi:hypothetical protein